MKIKKSKLRMLCITLIFLLVACSMPGGSPTEPPTTLPPTPTNAPASTEAPTATPGITHTTIPINLPAEHNNHAGDFDASTTANNKEAPGGDRFSWGTFERPFNANTMDVYFPYLDIVDLTVYQDDTWAYASIILKDLDANGKLPGKYALEIDLDANGRGDFLVLVSNPTSTDWSTEGVQIWQDVNHDIGGDAVILADEHPKPGDGYEAMVFDNGKGNDPDAAWARISPDDPKTIQLTVKQSILNDDAKFMIGAWAGMDALNPASFDINDHMTHEQAGASIRGYAVYYPIKGLAEIDNTCRVPIGFVPTGGEPGLCPTFVPEQLAPGVPTPIFRPPPPACSNICNNGQNPYPDCSCIPG